MESAFSFQPSKAPQLAGVWPVHPPELSNPAVWTNSHLMAAWGLNEAATAAGVTRFFERLLPEKMWMLESSLIGVS
jgi:hypothetical protein